tara:strand:- start:1709 stop:2452 length:744 start_codon:yes stop_codon:yes gene_type:complete
MISDIIGKNQFYFSSLYSTNNWLLDMLKTAELPNGLIVSAGFQESGRGMVNTVWESERNQNVLLSLLLKNLPIDVSDQFVLNKAVAIGVLNYLKSVGIAAEIKWPNDIVVNHNKIAGTLIQNTLIGKRIKNTVVGIGLNVNQTFFSDFKRKATSIGLEKENTSNLQLTINNMLPFIAYQFDHLRVGRKNLDKNYLDNLYLSNLKRPYLFNGEKIEAVIKGVTPEGKLKLLSNSNRLILADLKAIEFL